MFYLCKQGGTQTQAGRERRDRKQEKRKKEKRKKKEEEEEEELRLVQGLKMSNLCFLEPKIE